MSACKVSDDQARPAEQMQVISIHQNSFTAESSRGVRRCFTGAVFAGGQEAGRYTADTACVRTGSGQPACGKGKQRLFYAEKHNSDYGYSRMWISFQFQRVRASDAGILPAQGCVGRGTWCFTICERRTELDENDNANDKPGELPG